MTKLQQKTQIPPPVTIPLNCLILTWLWMIPWGQISSLPHHCLWQSQWALPHSSAFADPQMYNSTAHVSNHAYTDHATVVLTPAWTSSDYTRAYWIIEREPQLSCRLPLSPPFPWDQKTNFSKSCPRSVFLLRQKKHLQGLKRDFVCPDSRQLNLQGTTTELLLTLTIGFFSIEKYVLKALFWGIGTWDTLFSI